MRTCLQKSIARGRGTVMFGYLEGGVQNLNVFGFAVVVFSGGRGGGGGEE